MFDFSPWNQTSVRNAIFEGRRHGAKEDFACSRMDPIGSNNQINLVFCTIREDSNHVVSRLLQLHEIFAHMKTSWLNFGCK